MFDRWRDKSQDVEPGLKSDVLLLFGSVAEVEVGFGVCFIFNNQIDLIGYFFRNMLRFRLLHFKLITILK